MHKVNEVTYATDTVNGTTIKWSRLIVNGEISAHLITSSNGATANFPSHRQAQAAYLMLTGRTTREAYA